MSEDDSICDICWKSFIWACPIAGNIPKNTISCSAYEPTDVYLKEQEIISKIVKKIGYVIVECEGHSTTYYHNKLIELKEELIKKGAKID